MGVDIVSCTSQITRLAQLVNEYKWLLDSYIIEFFTESHWSKLPKPWREALAEADLLDVAWLLLGRDAHDTHAHSNKPLSKVYPLSLLAFSVAAHSLTLPRLPTSSEGPLPQVGECSQLEGLEHVFRCHVKLKKQHEIKVFGEVIHQLSLRTNCRNIIDVGSGQGHLARYLAHKYGMSVTGVEGVGSHLTTAAKYDRGVKRLLAKGILSAGSGHHGDSGAVSDSGSLTHVEAMIRPDTPIEEILSLLNTGHVNTQRAEREDSIDKSSTIALSCNCSTSQSGSHAAGTKIDRHEIPLSRAESRNSCDDVTMVSHDSRFVLVGLHTCGDLAPTILRAFARSRCVVGVASVGCCYMKLTCQGGGVMGYPLSKFGQELGCVLSYEARELACHSNEMLKKKLQQMPGSFDRLKVHCHRAAVEVILRRRGLRRSQVRISKRVSKRPFKEYARALLQSITPPLATPTLQLEEELDELSPSVEEHWRRVVVFIMLRLTLAPCVESIVLLDRALFLAEQGCKEVTLFPLFDPALSPRNHIVMAT